ncbi:MAG: TadE/TadG family type IV pilus assembly protein, partial [Chloroflexota bacterium]
MTDPRNLAHHARRAEPRARNAQQRGQSLVEFALVAPLLFLIMLGIMEFGFMFERDVAITNAARSGARWAATHPTAWSNASPAPSNTIEGQVQYAGGTGTVPNDDSHLVITSLVPGGGSPTTCGTYSASSGGFVASSGYT